MLVYLKVANVSLMLLKPYAHVQVYDAVVVPVFLQLKTIVPMTRSAISFFISGV